MTATTNFTAAIDPLHDGFMRLLPRVETHARVYFRAITCSQTRADRISETIALAYKWFRRLAERGRDANRFPAALASLAAKAVASGRRAVGMERAKDVMSFRAQRRRGFKVERLPTTCRTSHDDLYGTARGQRLLDEFEERLRDNRKTPVPEQVSFRCDFPAFLGSLSERDRRLARYLALGHRAKDAARRFGMSAGRVTQLRQGWCRDWHLSNGEELPANLNSVATCANCATPQAS